MHDEVQTSETVRLPSNECGRHEIRHKPGFGDDGARGRLPGPRCDE